MSSTAIRASRFARSSGITEWPRIVRTYANDMEKRTQARRLNLSRRHLDSDAKRALIEAELKDRPEVSDRAIAADLGVSHPTVAAVRREAERGGKIYHHAERTGRDGIRQPAKKPIKITGISLPGRDGAAAIRKAKGILWRENAAKLRAAYEARKEHGGRVDDLHTLIQQGKRFPVILADSPLRWVS
jgi:hypothetical protein